MKIKVTFKPLKRTPQQREASEKLDECLYNLALKKLKENMKLAKPVKVG